MCLFSSPCLGGHSHARFQYPARPTQTQQHPARPDFSRITLGPNEYRTAQRLEGDYWLYVVYNCSTQYAMHIIQNPARLDWQPVVVEHYRLDAAAVFKVE